MDMNFDFASETPAGRDPDNVSPTLRRYHQLLWSKGPLSLTIPATKRQGYLLGTDTSGREFCFASDAITTSYTTWTRPATLVKSKSSLTTEQRSRYLSPPYTIASTMIWPLRSRHRPSLNQARGTRGTIADRIDLTMECIRQHYAGQSDSPLADVVENYSDFFAIFKDFVEFAEFFHLQDLVDPTTGEIRFFLPFDGFVRHGAPRTTDEYVAFREATLAFIDARTHRILDWITATSQ